MGWNLADIIEGLENTISPETDALIHGERIISWGELAKRSNNLARQLHNMGMKPGDKIAFYQRNSPAYMEALIACFKGRFIHVNVNYRYTDDELLYILDNSDAAVVIFDDEFSARVAGIRQRAINVRHWINVCDDACREAAEEHNYEALASRGDGTPLNLKRSPDDLLFIYTGVPKGVMWRQEDFFNAVGGGAIEALDIPAPENLAQHLAAIKPMAGSFRQIIGPPMMHGTGMITGIMILLLGGTVITLTQASFDPDEAWNVATNTRATAMTIVGDVFAKPLLRALRETRSQYELSLMTGMTSSGTAWSKEVKHGLLAYLPQMALTDGFGSSEAFGIATSVTTVDGEIEAATFSLGPNCKVFSEDFREIQPGSLEAGLVARSGPIPQGYYKDTEKSAKTFPVIDGVRYSIPGDWCTVDSAGILTLLGRGSACVNTGGEKVYAEEVEEVLKRHSSIEDALVVGLADKTWGQRIVGVVQLSNSAHLDQSVLQKHARQFLAAYKVPKDIIAIYNLGRGPNGKADYTEITRYAESKLTV